MVHMLLLTPRGGSGCSDCGFPWQKIRRNLRAEKDLERHLVLGSPLLSDELMTSPTQADVYAKRGTENGAG